VKTVPHREPGFQASRGRGGSHRPGGRGSKPKGDGLGLTRLADRSATPLSHSETLPPSLSLLVDSGASSAQPEADARAGGVRPPAGAAAPLARPSTSAATGGHPEGGTKLGSQYYFKWADRSNSKGYINRSILACELGSWTVKTWRKDDPGKVGYRRFECRSWRHEGECRQWKGAQDFVRVKEALESRDGWLYLVLTFDQSRWKNEWSAYRGGGKMWHNRLRSLLIRKYGKIDYVQTWERHQSGFPHVNLVIHNKAMLTACAVEDCTHRRRVGSRVRLCAGYAALRQEIKQLAVRAGFGPVIWMEPMRGREALAGYVTKLSRELVGAGVKNQVPVNAPSHFRRLRASRGLLPPPHKNDKVTGELLKVPVELLKVPVERAEIFELQVQQALADMASRLDDVEVPERARIMPAGEIDLLSDRRSPIPLLPLTLFSRRLNPGMGVS